MIECISAFHVMALLAATSMTDANTGNDKTESDAIEYVFVNQSLTFDCYFEHIPQTGTCYISVIHKLRNGIVKVIIVKTLDLEMNDTEMLDVDTSYEDRVEVRYLDNRIRCTFLRFILEDTGILEFGANCDTGQRDIEKKIQVYEDPRVWHPPNLIPQSHITGYKGEIPKISLQRERIKNSPQLLRTVVEFKTSTYNKIDVYNVTIFPQRGNSSVVEYHYSKPDVSDVIHVSADGQVLNITIMILDMLQETTASVDVKFIFNVTGVYLEHNFEIDIKEGHQKNTCMDLTIVFLCIYLALIAFLGIVSCYTVHLKQLLRELEEKSNKQK